MVVLPIAQMLCNAADRRPALAQPRLDRRALTEGERPLPTIGGNSCLFARNIPAFEPVRCRGQNPQRVVNEPDGSSNTVAILARTGLHRCSRNQVLRVERMQTGGDGLEEGPERSCNNVEEDLCCVQRPRP